MGKKLVKLHQINPRFSITKELHLACECGHDVPEHWNGLLSKLSPIDEESFEQVMH